MKEIKTFPEKQKLRYFVASRSVLEEIQKEAFQGKQSDSRQ